MARERNIENIQLESDCLVAVKEVLKKDESFCEWGSVIVDIQDISLEFESCMFYHVNRKANAVAHNLAKYQCQFGEHKLWWDAFTPSVCNPDVRY